MVKLILLPGTLFSCRARYNFGGCARAARRARSEKILISGLCINFSSSPPVMVEWKGLVMGDEIRGKRRKTSDIVIS